MSVERQEFITYLERIRDGNDQARARAVLAPLAPRETGAAWMREAAAPRPGFRVSAALRTTLACTEDAAWRA